MHAAEAKQTKMQAGRGRSGEVVLHAVHQRALALLNARKVQEVRGAVRLCTPGEQRGGRVDKRMRLVNPAALSNCER